MLRIAFRPLVRHQRSFVSPVLLTRTSESKSVVELKEAEERSRGLPLQRNKATLITHIQDHDQRRAIDAISSRPLGPAGVRAESTVSVTPGIPPALQHTRPLPKGFTNVHLPDISQPDPEPPIQIPFLPDFWESYANAATQTNVEPVLPKLLVVAGASTHLDDGPSHNLHDSHADLSSHVHLETSSSIAPSRETGGFWRDVADDIGIPVHFNIQAVQRAALDAVPRMSGPPQKTYSRPLNVDESNGLWLILGLLAGTWFVGGLRVFSGRPKAEKTTGSS